MTRLILVLTVLAVMILMGLMVNTMSWILLLGLLYIKFMVLYGLVARGGHW